MSFNNIGMCVEKVFDLSRKQVFATSDDHFLESTDDFSVAVRVENKLIAGF